MSFFKPVDEDAGHGEAVVVVGAVAGHNEEAAGRTAEDKNSRAEAAAAVAADGTGADEHPECSTAVADSTGDAATDAGPVVAGRNVVEADGGAVGVGQLQDGLRVEEEVVAGGAAGPVDGVGGDVVAAGAAAVEPDPEDRPGAELETKKKKRTFYGTIQTIRGIFESCNLPLAARATPGYRAGRADSSGISTRQGPIKRKRQRRARQGAKSISCRTTRTTSFCEMETI